MRKSIAKQKLSLIPKSKNNKINFELSLKAKNRFSKLKYDSINKETLDGSVVDTLFFNPESLENSKTSIYKNNSLGKINNNNLIVFTSSLKYPLDSKQNLPNISKRKNSKKTFELSYEKMANEEKNNTLLETDKNRFDEHDLNQDDTDRIDYRYYQKIPEIESKKEMKYYWLATYDKLMKKSKIIKILNYYTDFEHLEPGENKLNDNNNNFKEKTMIVPGFEIYFLQNFNKPFIRQKKGGIIFIKLYLLNIEQINKIFSYINRLEYKSYINDLDIITKKHLYKNIINFNKSIYNYSTIFCLGSFMNINIYLFSHIEKNNSEEKNDINELPSSNKLAKLIKVLMLNFPDFTKKDFIDYLTNYLNNNKLNNSLNNKKKEISYLLTSANRKSFPLNNNKNSTNSVIKNIINKIPTYSSSSHNTPNEFLNYSEIKNISEININKQPKDINSFDFFTKINIKNEIKKQTSEKILNKIHSISLQLSNKLHQKTNMKINDINNAYKKSISKIKNRSFQNKNKNIDSLSKGINHIQLINQEKKSLTRKNTKENKIHYEKKDSNINNKLKINKIRNVNKNHNFVIKIDNGKENNSNIININHLKKEKLNADISFKINNNNIIKTEINRKNTRNKAKVNFNPFYYTKENDTNNNCIGKKTNKVISSIRKIISQKLNNIHENTSSVFKNDVTNKSNNSLIRNNNNSNIINFKNLVCLSNNSNKMKTSEYITPRKKRFYYYYH